MPDGVRFGGHVFDTGDGLRDDDVTASSRLERALLAALLCNPVAFEALPDGFGAHVLVVEDHGDIFEAAKTAAANGAKILYPAVEAALPHLAGGDGYIRQLVAAVISARTEDAVAYAIQLQEMAHRRALLALADEIRMQAQAQVPLGAGQPVPAIVARAADALERIAEGQRTAKPAVTLADAARVAIQAGERAAANGGLLGITMGFRGLDRRFGGFEPGNLYILGARPAMGKSALAQQIALRVARTGAPVLFLSLEMSDVQAGQRALALLSGVALEVIRNGGFTGGEWMVEKVWAAQSRLEELPISLVDQPGMTLGEIRLRAKAAIRRWGRLGLLIVDHLHIMGKPPLAAKHGDTQAISENSAGLKHIAKELGVPVLALAQLSRATEGREDKRPTLADLRQSGSIEQDADGVMFIYRPDYYAAQMGEDRRPGESEAKWQARIEDQRRIIADTAGRAEILCEKVRQGQAGTEYLCFDGKHMRFSEKGEG